MFVLISLNCFRQDETDGVDYRWFNVASFALKPPKELIDCLQEYWKEFKYIKIYGL